VIGHEIAGHVEAVGPGVDGYSAGESVVLSPPGWSCGECRICLRGQENLCGSRRALSYEFPGGLAEYVAVPAALVSNGSVHKAPTGTDMASVSIAEPLACCINGQEQLRRRPDDRVLIVGAGPIGMMHLELVRAYGAEAVAMADVSDERLRIAASSGDVDVFDARSADLAQQVADWSDGYGPDVAIVAASSPEACGTAFSVVGRCGQVLLFAGLPKDRQMLEVDMNDLHYRQIACYGCFGSTPAQGDEALRLLVSGDVDPARLVTHRYGLESIGEAIEVAGALTGLKVVALPTDAAR